MGMTKAQKQASFKLSFCMALVASLREKETPKSRLWVKLDNLEEHLGRVLDEYRIERFHKTDLDKAAEIFDVVEAEIQRMYP